MMIFSSTSLPLANKIFARVFFGSDEKTPQLKEQAHLLIGRQMQESEQILHYFMS